MRVAGVENRPRIAVVGAGIGGLSLAAALAASGTGCEVFEQGWRMAEGGGGLELAPNAVRPLHRLGLGPVLRARAVRAEATEIRGWDGRAVARVPFGTAGERLFGAPYYTVHRAHLHEALLARVPDERVHFGRRLLRLAEDRNGVTLHFEDGSTHRADLVVGADGVRSVVREVLDPDGPRFSGLGVYQGLLPMERLPRALARDARVRLWLGPGAHLVCYPVSGGSEVSFTATFSLPDSPPESWSEGGDPEDLAREFGHWQGVPSQVAAAARTSGTVWRRGLHVRESLKQWSTGRVTLLGDAAHPALSFTSQGAGQSVEDAFDLAACLAGARQDQVSGALTRYESLRVPRVASVEQALCEDELHLPDGDEQRERDADLQRTASLEYRVPLYSYESGRRQEPVAPCAVGPGQEFGVSG